MMQIPLDNNEVEDLELQAAKNVEQEVAKHVSGADLMNKSSSSTSH